MKLSFTVSGINAVVCETKIGRTDSEGRGRFGNDGRAKELFWSGIGWDDLRLHAKSAYLLFRNMAV